MSTIAPNDVNILYSPYTWKLEATKASSMCSGAYLKATIEGSPADLTMLFDQTNLASTHGAIVYRVDAGTWTRLTVSGTSYALTLDTSWPVHTVEIIIAVRGGVTPIWPAPPNGVIQFAGFSSTTAINTRKVQARALHGYALGDSLAMGILAGAATANDARYGWAYGLGDNLGADIGVHGFGGVGLTQTGDGGVPVFGTIWNQLWDGELVDFTTIPPDFMATMPGTNDSTDDATVTAAAVSLLNAMLAATPATCPIFLIRALKGSKATAIQAAIAACTTPTRVHWIDTTGWWVAADSSDGTHPYGYANVNDITPRLAEAMSPIILAAKSPSTVTNTFVYNGTAWIAAA